MDIFMALSQFVWCHLSPKWLIMDWWMMDNSSGSTCIMRKFAKLSELSSKNKENKGKILKKKLKLYKNSIFLGVMNGWWTEQSLWLANFCSMLDKVEFLVPPITKITQDWSRSFLSHFLPFSANFKYKCF